MSAEFHSSNPFRRKAATGTPLVEQSSLDSYDSPAQQTIPLSTSQTHATDQIRVQTKPVKKVRVQSPPPSSPEADLILGNFPTSIPQQQDISRTDNDPFENEATDSSEDSDDETETLKSTPLLPNPFEKTLATLERTDGGDLSGAAYVHMHGGAGMGKASLDVEAFKRLLMTGSADAAASASSLAPPINIAQVTLNDGGSSTDASSSASRQSIFEPIQETHPETPRTSHEVSDPDDERRRFATDGLASYERRKPLPPSSRHGKLIKMELRDETVTGVDSSALPGWKGAQPSSVSAVSIPSTRSSTDLNKPLPAAPTRASHESDRESIFDREAAGKTPEPASPPSTQTRKTPPVPPLTRRHSQLTSESKAARPASVRLPTNTEEGGLNSSSNDNTIPPPAFKAPPPPPSRRPASIRMSQVDSIPTSVTSQEQQRPRSKSGSAPTPPPARMSSIRHSSRPPSIMSVDLTSKRTSAAPPPPPPPRQRASSRTSIDGPVLSSGSSRRTSSDYYRRSMDSTKEESIASQADQKRPVEGISGANDILADLTALQREVDALRGQYETKGPS